jgi:glycosyltransferase involved in cell wall biosynthesis
MKVFVLAPRENWICDRIAQEYVRECGDICTQDPARADILWLLAGWCWNHIHPEILRQKKVILSVHHIVPEKFTENKRQEFVIRDQFVDAYHVPNKYTEAFISKLTKKPIHVLPYWIDDKKWSPLDKGECKKKIGIPESAIVVGSFQRDSEGDTANPKLEKGPDLLCDVIEKMPKVLPLVILLGGWRRKYVANRLTEAGINFILHEKVSQEDLEVMYNACDLYMVCSRHEGGPQAVLEASKMKVPIISTPVGIAEQVLHQNCIYEPTSMLAATVPGKTEVEYNEMNVKKFYLSTMKEKYNEMLAEVMS